MSSSPNKLLQDGMEELCDAFTKQADAVEKSLHCIGVGSAALPMRPNYEHLTPLERFDSSAKYLREMGEAGSKHSQQYTHLINQHVLAIQRVAQTDLQDINNETINGLSEAASKRVLGLAIKTVVYQRKQMLFYADNKEASERIGSVFSRQRTAWMNKTCEIEQELLRQKDRTSTLEEDVTKRSAEVQELRAFMKTLAKRLHNVVTGSSKLPKEMRKCEKNAVEASVERIIGIVQVQRESDAQRRQQQRTTEQLHDTIEDLRRQLNEAVEEKANKESEIDEIVEKRIRCSVCMDREKNTVFVCGHAYCNECASEWRKCSVCVTEKGNRPITFKHPLFL